MQTRTSNPVRRAAVLLAACGIAATVVLAAEPGLFPRVRAPAPPSGTATISPVTDAMLLKPPAEDWLMWRGTLNSWGYSPLDQINTSNAGGLQLVWTRPLESGTQEGTPLVHDGVMFFPNPGDTIQAIEAATGNIIWEHRRKSPEDIERFINQPFINRNLAIHGNLIIDTSADGAMYAIDARTGKDVWETPVLDYKRGIHQTSGPIVADGKVFSGRGCEPIATGNPDDCVITAHDAATGKELWRRRTMPRPGEVGDETWGDVPYEDRKQVGAWMPPSYDPELKLLYIGTSVTSPTPKYLLGGTENQHLYHNSTLALNPETGEIVWYYQHLIDHWDLDHTFERILVDTEVAPAREEVAWMNPDIKPGQTYKVITGIPGKTGIVYTLDRRNGQFLWARPTIYQTVVESIDGKTGKVKQTADTVLKKKGDSAFLCPTATGGKNWPAGAYSPLTKSMYFPLQNTCATVTATSDSRSERGGFGMRSTGTEIAPGNSNVGSIHAISTVTGHTDWKHEQRAATTSLLTTGGGLLFGGDLGGRFRAYDQRTGQVVWEVNLGSQVSGYPVSFAVNGRQYIAASTGQVITAGGYLALAPEIRVGSTNALYVFALPAGAAGMRVAPQTIAPPAIAATPATAAAMPNCKDLKQAAASMPANGVSAASRFTHAQGEAGRKLFVEQQCAVCHGPTMGGAPGAPALNDNGFRTVWQGRSVEALFACARNTMPPGRAGTLSDADYVALVAAILEANGYQPGNTPLPADAAGRGRIVLDQAR